MKHSPVPQATMLYYLFRMEANKNGLDNLKQGIHPCIDEYRTMFNFVNNTQFEELKQQAITDIENLNSQINQ